MTTSRPETPLDLQILLQQYFEREGLELTGDKFESLFDVDQEGDNLLLEKHRDTHGRRAYLSGGLFTATCKFVENLGGEYDQQRQRWMIPLGIDSEAVYPAPNAPLPGFESPLSEEGGEFKSPQGPQELPVMLSPNMVSPQYALIPTHLILSMPFQSRLTFVDADLGELAESIRQHGLLEPLLVRERKGRYELIAGERRLRAAKKAGLTTAPCLIQKEMGDLEALECHLIENLQRKDLTDYEKARVLQYMTEKFGYTQQEIGQKLGKNQPWVSRHLQMLELERDQNIPRGIKQEQLTERHAREILQVPPEKRDLVTKKIARHVEKEGELPSARTIKEFAKPFVKKPVEPEDGRGAESIVGFEPTPVPGTPKRQELSFEERQAIKYYPNILVTETWGRVPRETWRLGFLKVLMEVLWDIAQKTAGVEEIFRKAKERYEAQHSEVRQI